MRLSVFASTGIRSDIIRLANLYGVHTTKITSVVADTEGVTFEWVESGSGPDRVLKTLTLPLDANPPNEAGTPIYDELLKEGASW